MIKTFFLLLMATGMLATTTDPIKSYAVKNIGDKEIIINGKGDNQLWENAIALTDFIYPWENETPPLTSFKALHSKDWLYCLYNVKDDNMNVYVKTNEKSEVVYSDRVPRCRSHVHGVPDRRQHADGLARADGFRRLVATGHSDRLG